MLSSFVFVANQSPKCGCRILKVPYPVSPLNATLMDLPASVANKRLTVRPKPFRCNIYKKPGGYPLQAKYFPLSSPRPPVPVSPTFQVPYTLQSSVCSKSFPCHSYENCRSVSQFCAIWFTLSTAEGFTPERVMRREPGASAPFPNVPTFLVLSLSFFNVSTFQRSNVPTFLVLSLSFFNVPTVLHTRSATVVSMRLKKISPPTSTTATPPADASSSSPGAWPTPVSAQRNPSITPAMGFSPYSQRHRCGTSELGYATGEANIQNCTRNGIIVVKSRYKALSAEVHSPTASAVNTARRISACNNTQASPITVCL